MLRKRRNKRLLPGLFEGTKSQAKAEEHQTNEVPPELLEGLKVKLVRGRAREQRPRRIFK